MKTTPTDVLNFHKMIITHVLKDFMKGACYRDYKKLDRLIFKIELDAKLNQQMLK